MFEELRQAWREAVDNFYRELGTDAPEGDVAGRLAGMRRDHAAAEKAVQRVHAERRRAEVELAREREEEATCRRRQQMAARIEDEETAGIAAEFAERHGRRAVVLEQVVVALTAEWELRTTDLSEMRQALEEAESRLRADPPPGSLGHAGGGNGGAGAGAASAGPGDSGAGSGSGGAFDPRAAGGSSDAGSSPFARDPFQDEEREKVFQRMEKEARERAAEQRLEELKRKMR